MGNGWIKWEAKEGAVCPVSGETKVDYVFDDDVYHCYAASRLDWVSIRWPIQYYRLHDGTNPPAPGSDAEMIAELVAALKAESDADTAFDEADEYTHRADAEGWLNDPTGSLHVNEAWNRANSLRAKAKNMRLAAIHKAESRQ